MEPDLTDPTVYKWSKVEGDPGKSLVSITEHYLVSDQDSGITIDTAGWSTGAIRAGNDAGKEVSVEL